MTAQLIQFPSLHALAAARAVGAHPVEDAAREIEAIVAEFNSLVARQDARRIEIQAQTKE